MKKNELLDINFISHALYHGSLNSIMAREKRNNKNDVVHLNLVIKHHRNTITALFTKFSKHYKSCSIYFYSKFSTTNYYVHYYLTGEMFSWFYSSDKYWNEGQSQSEIYQIFCPKIKCLGQYVAYS